MINSITAELHPEQINSATAELHPEQINSATAELHAWVREIAVQTTPDKIVWCTGSQHEADQLSRKLVSEGKLIRLNPEWRPNSFLARTDPGDVARVEACTFICTNRNEDAGPTNNWCDPAEMRTKLHQVFAGSMAGRTLYVVPFSMGSIGGEFSKIGVQLTDSEYVVLSMQIMTRMGTEVLRLIDQGQPWVRTVHSLGYPLRDQNGRQRPDVSWPCNENKYIVHFPESREVWSYGSGYGGNALLAKKSFALRIGSAIAKDEGWLAEHMLLIRLVSPQGRAVHIAAAFPSACGKTNLAMLQPSLPGWRVETIGDDIVWLRPGRDGRLWAINPEAGFFGVAPGTGVKTNPTAVATLWGNTIFTNVALREDGDVWWEGLSDQPPTGLTDWEGRPWSPLSTRPAAHPNSRFAVSIAQCPQLADEDVLAGVPIDAIIFGGRRSTNVPLVAEARSWAHGVFMGATIASEKTAAAEGVVGELRRDPFAMLPFLGYNMADHWAHWLSVGSKLGGRAPKVFQVNWFRKNAEGEFLWPGFAENSRVLKWIAERISGEAAAVHTPIGLLPESIDIAGLNLSDDVIAELFQIDKDNWLTECDLTEEFFNLFDGRVPKFLWDELNQTRRLLRVE